MLEKWNGNIFTVDDNSYSILEIVEGHEEKINLKTDLHGDHKGSWQGIDHPVRIEGGIDAIVLKNTDDIENLKSPYPLLSIEKVEDVKDYTLPYGHVERYGAVSDYEWDNIESGTDNTKPIQTAINVIAEMGGGEIILGDGLYKVDGTLYLNGNGHYTPLTFKGKEGKYISLYPKFRPYGLSGLVKNTDGDLIRVNLKEDGSSYSLKDGAQGGHYNITIKNMCLINQNDYAIVNGVNCYRVRINFTDILADGLNIVLLQKETDTLGQYNYCDWGTIKRIKCTKIKEIGFKLYYSDNTVIEQVFNSEYKSTMTSFIEITNGSGITLRNICCTWQQNNYSDSVDGSDGFIKLIGVCGASISDMYIERTQLTNAIILNNSSNITIDNINEKYEGNNLIKLYKANNISINNIVRDGILRSGYYDFMIVGNNSNISINNTRFLASYQGEQRPTSINSKINTFVVKGRDLRLKVKYDSGAFKVYDKNNNLIDSSFVKMEFNNNALVLGNCIYSNGIISNVDKLYIHNSAYSHDIALYDNKIHFYKDGTIVTLADNKCICEFTLTVY